MSELGPPRRAELPALLRGLARSNEAGRDLAGALQHQAGLHSPEAAEAMRAALRALRAGQAASRALATLGELSPPEQALLDAPRRPGAWAGTLRLLAARCEHEALLRERWVGAVAWPPLGLWLGLAVTALPHALRFGAVSPRLPWLLAVAAAATAVSVLPAMLLAHPEAARRARWLPSGVELVTARRLQRFFAGLAAALEDGVALDRARVVAAGLSQDAALIAAVPSRANASGGAWIDALPGTDEAARQSLRTAGSADAMAERARALATREQHRWEAAHANLRTRLRLLVTVVAALTVAWSARDSFDRINAAGLPDGKIMNPERIDQAIDRERPKQPRTPTDAVPAPPR